MQQFQRVFTCKIWLACFIACLLRYSRERAIRSSKVRALGNLNLNFKTSKLLFAAQGTARRSPWAASRSRLSSRPASGGTPGRGRARTCHLGDLYTESGQTLQGSFSAVSTPIFASKYALESSRRDLHNALLCTVLNAQNCVQKSLKMLPIFSQNLAKFDIL